MAASAHVCIKMVRLCLLAAEARGLDGKQLARQFGLDAAALADPYARVPHTLATQLWQEVPELAGDDAFGLHAAERWYAQTLDAYDAAMPHCQTLGEVFRMLSRYVRLMHEGATVEVEQQGQLARVTERFAPPCVVPRHLGELIIGMWVLRSRRLIGPALRVHELTFAHPTPSSVSEHHRLLAAPLRFGAPAYSMVLPAACLDAPIVGAEPMVGVVLQRHLQDELQRLPPLDDFLAEAERAAREALTDPAVDIDRMARRLRTSARTLQRRLHLAGTSFQALIENARRQQALHLLSDQRLTLTEVAFQTGYSEMSTFYRAFRRWTGQTPREYRDAAIR